MSLHLQAHADASSDAGQRRNYAGWAALILIVLLIGGGGWYYFFGSKPAVSLTVSFRKGSADFQSEKLFPAGEGLVLALAGDELKLCDVPGRREKWSATVPPQPDVDPRWQADINARFLRLQEWAATLSQKRAGVSTPPAAKSGPEVEKYQADLKAFNEEVAKYQAELVAARADAVKTPPKRTQREISAAAGDAEDEDSPAGVPDSVNKLLGRSPGIKPPGAAVRLPAANPSASAPSLKPVVSAEVKMLEDRMKKRQVQLADMQRTIDTKTKAAKTDLAREGVKELEAKRARLAAEQQADEAAVARAKGPATEPAKDPVVTKAVSAPEPPKPPAAEPAADVVIDNSGERGEPTAVVLGDRVWLVDGQHAVSFGLADGVVKGDIRLAGEAVQAYAQANELFIVASAGPEARQLTRIDSTGATQSMYVPAPRRGLVSAREAEGGNHLNILSRRVEFTGAGGSLALVDIRLLERKSRTQDLIKPGADKALAAAAENATAHSTDELLAISNLLASDAARLNGETTRDVDESTYEITVRRPFESAVPPLVEKLQGNVRTLSTPSLDLLTAGTMLVALDHTNKKLWEATLGAPLPVRSDAGAGMEESPPMLEKGGKLYFADGAFLSAFQAASGQVLWRLPNVGIRKIEIDGDGYLYVATDNLSVDALTYSVTEHTDPATASVMKIDAATGKVLWNAQKFQDVWASGKDVYAFREIINPNDATNRVFDAHSVPEARTKIYKLSRSSGQPIWDWYEPRRPRHVLAYQKSVALLFPSELQVIHSIAW